MIQWFKDGKTLPKRYAWEIVIGAHDQFVKEDSLVIVNIEEGVTCDVIGDVHGTYFSREPLIFKSLIARRSILRCVASVLFDWPTNGEALPVNEW